MKIEAVTVCVNYSDFLEHCIIANKDVFDKWVIVTDTKDLKTKELCDRLNIMCIQTDVFYEGGAKFRKYAGINEGLKHLDRDGWVVFIDGDIVLSDYARRTFESLDLDPTKLYGIDRLNCTGFERWIEYKKGPGVLFENWLLHGAGLEWGARIIHIYGEDGDNGAYTGWKPLGFFQMAHSSQFDIYPEGSEDASHGDLAFAKLWDRKHREIIPELIGIHLDTSDYKSHNWWGRRSNPFTYSVKTTIFTKVWDRFVIWFNSLCRPTYKPMCLSCKVFNYLKDLFKL